MCVYTDLEFRTIAVRESFTESFTLSSKSAWVEWSVFDMPEYNEGGWFVVDGRLVGW